MNQFKTFGRTFWTGDEPDGRPLPTQDSATQKDANIHSSSGIRKHDPIVRVAKTHALVCAATVTGS
jgi:hypothetical protein